jgi:hypothetical protein
MQTNYLIVALAALIPTLTGFIWYNPNILGKPWMKASGVTEDMMKTGNMAVIFIVSILLSFLLAVEMSVITIHQNAVLSLFVSQPGWGEEGSATMLRVAEIMEEIGPWNRSFGHGAFHGALAGIFFVLPVLGTNSLFERKGWKYIWINVGYWTLTLALMGGVICQWA